MKPTRITIHCSDSPNAKRCDIKEIDAWHKARGFDREGDNELDSIGYHLVIQPDGEPQWGRGLNETGAHVQGDNKDNVGICLVGTDKFTIEQFIALRSKLDSICMVYEIPKWQVWCHHQFPSAIKQGKTCPNIPINPILGWYLTGDHRAIQPYLVEL